MITNKDIKIKCQDCGSEFIFSAPEQNFYEEKGFIPPKRCRYCRQKHKNNIERRNYNGYKEKNN